MDRVAIAVMRTDHVLHQPAHDVRAEVRGQVPDAQSASGRSCRIREGRIRCTALLHQCVVRPVEARKLGARDVEVLQASEDSRQCLRILRPVFQIGRTAQVTLLLLRIAESADAVERGVEQEGCERGALFESEKVGERGFTLASREARVEQLIPDLLVRGVESARGLQRGNGVVPAAKLVPRVPEVVVCLRRVRRQRRGVGERGLTGLDALASEFEMSQRQPRGGRARLQGRRLVQGFRRLVEISVGGKRHSEVVEDSGVSWRDVERGAVRRHCFAISSGREMRRGHRRQPVRRRHRAGRKCRRLRARRLLLRRRLQPRPAFGTMIGKSVFNCG